ncbi:MAG: hypothetical protein NC192_00255, partial [Muribaculaceae bacterium]|nr:hypothetical protein [Muribaculaceae bacterium]
MDGLDHKSVAIGYALGYDDGLNELFTGGSGGGDVYQVSGGEDGITVTMVQNRGENQVLAAEYFEFKSKEYKTITSLSSGSTTVTKTWSKRAITEVLRDGAAVWRLTLDSTGNVTAVLDGAGNDVLGGVTGTDGNSVTTDTPEGIALGWVLAYNKEQSDAQQKSIDAYKDGVADCDDVNKKEGVGGGSGDGGDGGGDGSGGGDDGSGDGSGGDGTGGGIPEKNFQAYKSLPLNDDGSVPIPKGSGAATVLSSPASTRVEVTKCDVVIVDARQKSTVWIGRFTNDGRYPVHEIYTDGKFWYSYGTGTGWYDYGFKVVDGKLVYRLDNTDW